MDELIFKQAAIDALWKALYEYEDKTEKQFQESEDLDVGDWMGHRIFVQNMNDIDRQTILNLPPAQPDLDEWCTDCKEYDQERHCCPRWSRVIRETLKDAQPERKRGKWKVCNILDYAQRPTGRKVGMCSNCGHLTDEFRTMVEASKKLTNFCSECGSYNREESNNGRSDFETGCD